MTAPPRACPCSYGRGRALRQLACFELVAGDTDPGVVSLGTWIEAGPFPRQLGAALRHTLGGDGRHGDVRRLLIHVYAWGTWRTTRTRATAFFTYLSLFAFSMLMLVTADNLLQLFFGWEGGRPLLVSADRLLVRPAAAAPRR